jgi:hypothetical protein
MKAQATPAILNVLAMVGNIRIDAITMVVSDDIGTDRDAGYVTWIFQGLYDPARVVPTLKRTSNRMKQQKHGDLTVFYERDSAWCAVDEHTFILAVSDANDGSQIKPVLEAWTAKAKADAATAQAFAPAFDAVVSGKTRLAAAGALSPAQRALVRPELERELARIKQRAAGNPMAGMQQDLMAWVLEVIKVENYTAHLDADLSLQIQATCADAAAAKVLMQKAKKADNSARQAMKQAFAKMKAQGANNPQAAQLNTLMKSMDLDQPLLEMKLQGNRLQASLKGTAATSIFGGMPMMLMMATRAAMQQQHIEMQQQMEEAVPPAQ